MVSSIATNKTVWRGVSLLKANILLPLLIKSILNTFSLRNKTQVYIASPPPVSREQSFYHKFIVLYLSKVRLSSHTYKQSFQFFIPFGLVFSFPRIVQEVQTNLHCDKITLFPHSHLFHPLNLPPILTYQASCTCYALHTGCRHWSGLSIQASKQMTAQSQTCHYTSGFFPLVCSQEHWAWFGPSCRG